MKRVAMKEPSEQNLDEVQEHSLRILKAQLEHGLIVETDDTMALHIPAGWLHATFTVTGGFLAGISTVTAEAIGLISKWMKFELESEKGDFQGNIEIYVRALEVALSSSKDSVLHDALEGWKQLQPQLSAGGAKITELQDILKQAWTDFFGWADKQRHCYHDADLSNYDFCDHFRTSHLSFLPSFQPLPSKRAKNLRNSSVYMLCW